MKEVLISIRPMWCEKIAARWKTLELRKTRPNIPLPFKCYIYQTKLKWMFNLLRSLKMDDVADTLTIGLGKVIGEFVCDHIMGHREMANADIAEQQSCVRRKDIYQYSGGKEVFGWHITRLKIYDKPKDIREFFYPCIKQKYPYCFDCEYGLQEGEERPFMGMRHYDVACGNWIKKPPQSWCYVEEKHVSSHT